MKNSKGVRVWEIQRGSRPQITFYDLDDTQVRSDDVVTEGTFLSDKELESLITDAFNAGRARKDFNYFKDFPIPVWVYATPADYIKSKEQP